MAEKTETSTEDKELKEIEIWENRQKLIKRLKGLHVMGKDARGDQEEEYQGLMIELDEEDPDKIPELEEDSVEDLFEYSTESIPIIVLSTGGDITRSAIKILPDGRAIYREVYADYDVDKSNYSFINQNEARELIQKSINANESEIRGLQKETDRLKQELEKI